MCLAATLLWCVLLLIKGVKRKNSKWDNLFAVFLVLLAVPQCLYTFQMGKSGSCTITAAVKSVNSTESEIEAETAGYTIFLEAPDLVTRLLEEGEEYVFMYIPDKSGGGRLQSAMRIP